VDHSPRSFYVHRTSNSASETFSTGSPVLFIAPFSLLSADYNPKSIKIREIVGKLYNFKMDIFPNEITLVRPLT
jgi:hypothetical protein